jgi:hypothetical protein
MFSAIASVTLFRFGTEGAWATLLERKSASLAGMTGFVVGISPAGVLKVSQLKVDREIYPLPALCLAAWSALADATSSRPQLRPRIGACDRTDLIFF